MLSSLVVSDTSDGTPRAQTPNPARPFVDLSDFTITSFFWLLIAIDRLPDLKNEIQGIANSEARSISQVCELLLSEGVRAYKKEGPKFIHHLVAKQKARVKDS